MTLSPFRAPQRPGTALPASQERLWFLDRVDPGRPVYNMPWGARLRGPLDADVLRRAFGLLVARHDALRTVFPDRDGVPAARVLPALELPLPVVPVASEEEALRLAGEEAARPFDLARGPLLRARLLRIGPEDHVLLCTVHHIVFDGLSAAVFYPGLFRAYAALARGEVPDLGAPPLPYAEAVRLQEAQRTPDELEAALAWWRERLASAPPLLALPTDRPRPPVPTYRGDTVPARLPSELLARLRALARRERVSLFMVLLAALEVVLARWSGQEDVSVGVPVAGRTLPETEELVGLFTNTLVLRGDLSGDPTFRELLARVRETALEAYDRQDAPLERLVQELAPHRSLAHAPLFQVMLSMRTGDGAPLEAPGLAVEPLRTQTRTARFDLTLFLAETPDEVTGEIEYATDLFDRSTVERLAAHLARVLDRVADDPEARVLDVPLLAADERHRAVVEWNETAAPVPAGTVVSRVARRLAEAPDAVAVVAGDAVLTARALQERSDRLARRLRARGAGPDVPVGLALERSADLVVGLLGILKAGSAYLPLDPSYPDERLAYMLENAGAPLLVTRASLAPRFAGAGARPVLVEEEEDAPASLAGRDAGPADLAYLIYTSGSTGRPKGVELTHGGLANLLEHFVRLLGPSPSDVLVSVTTLSFDIATLEMLLPLATGARLVLASPAEAADGAALAALLAREEATLFQATPTSYRLLLEAGWKGSPRLTCICGGEILARDLADQLLPRCRALYNGYGPTETTIYSAVERVTPGTAGVPIGRPIANTQIHVLDARKEPVPVGVPGEVWIGGAGVARGYRGRPDLTAERFVPSPFAPGALLYRTGDLARTLPDGRHEVLGRCDQQVKLRGFRIEPGEVEAALAAHPGVLACAVAVRGEGALARLVAWLVPSGAEAPPPPELRAHLARLLPDFMIPALFVPLAALPMTPNRKVDRAALPEPSDGDGAAGISRPPADAAEEAVVAVFREVLGREAVGAEDDFFALGGHSLLAARLFARLEKAFGRKLPLASIFTARTPAALAALLRGEAEGATWSPLVPIQPEGPKTPLFCFHAIGGNVLTYYDLAKHLGPDQPVWGLQARGLDGRTPPHDSVEEMAACYAREIRALRPEGPYHLCGSSFGGLVAYEVGRQLRDGGADVGILALFDTWGPDYPRRDTTLTARSLRWRRLRERVDLHVGNILVAEGLSGKLGYVATKAGRVWKDVRKHARRVRDRVRNALHPLPAELRKVESTSRGAMYRYEPGPYDGPITLFRATKQPAGLVPDPELGWTRVARGGLEVHEVAGYHGAIVYEPRIGPLAAQLAACLSAYEASRHEPAREEQAS